MNWEFSWEHVAPDEQILLIPKVFDNAVVEEEKLVFI